MVRIGYVLIAIVLVFSISLPGCAEDQEDPSDRLVEILQLTDEQLEQLETGTGTLHLREDQVNILSDYVAQLLDDLQPWLDESQWQEVKGILEAMLAQGEIDLQTLGPVAEAIKDSLTSEAEAGIGVYTNLVRLSTESTPTVEGQSQLTNGSPRSTCVTVYTPRDRIHGDKHYELHDCTSEFTKGKGSESEATADPNGGAIAVYASTDPFGAASAYALQQIKINVPAEATDITIASTLLYTSGTFSLLPLPFGGDETGIITIHPRQIHQDHEISEQVIDSWFSWYDAAKLAVFILGFAVSVPVGLVGAGVGLLATDYDALAYQRALQDYGEEEIITHQAGSLPAGDYLFEIGVWAEAMATFATGQGFVYAMVPEIEVSMNIPSLTLDISSTEGGYVIEPGEGAFPCCPGEEVDIVAVSYQGYRFTGWTGDVGTIDRPDIQSTYITMNDNYSIAANFEEIPPEQFDLTISSSAGGVVTTPGEGTFLRDSGTVVDLVAVAEEGFYFDNWSGDVDTIADTNDPTTIILMIEDSSITANFEEIPPDEFDLTTSSTTGGTVTTPGEGTFTYDSGTVVDLIAVAEEGYYFSHWSGDVDTIADANDPATTITMIGDHSITASFEEEEVVTFPDPNLEAAIREAIGKPTGDIYESDLNGLTTLDAYLRNIISLLGLEHCTGLTSLDLRSNEIIDMSPLANLTSLTFLRIGGNDIIDISPLVNLTNLWYLSVVGNQISDISALANLTNLTYLSIGGNQISDISPLANLTNLVYLLLYGNPISNLSPLANLINLTELHLHSNPINDISPLAELTNLTRLDLFMTPLSDISPLSNLTSLTNLKLWENQISDISPLASLPNLQYLSINGNQISDISPLDDISSLMTLNLGDNQISTIPSLSNLTNLTWINLSGNQISDISHLTDLTSVNELYLADNQISDISPLSNLTNLTHLNLSVNPISDISPLTNLTNLTELGIANNEISDISPLTNLTNLTELAICNNEISDISPLANLTNLTFLDLRVNQISDIVALVDNSGLGEGDFVNLMYLPLSEDSINIYIPQLQARGVTVYY